MLLNRGGREGKNGSQHDGIYRVRLIGRSPVDNASRWVLNRRRKTCLIKFQQKGGRGVVVARLEIRGGEILGTRIRSLGN